MQIVTRQLSCHEPPSLPLVGDCKNDRMECDMWAAAGYCSDHASVAALCRQSCEPGCQVAAPVVAAVVDSGQIPAIAIPVSNQGDPAFVQSGIPIAGSINGIPRQAALPLSAGGAGFPVQLPMVEIGNGPGKSNLVSFGNWSG